MAAHTRAYCPSVDTHPTASVACPENGSGFSLKCAPGPDHSGIALPGFLLLGETARALPVSETFFHAMLLALPCPPSVSFVCVQFGPSRGRLGHDADRWQRGVDTEHTTHGRLRRGSGTPIREHPEARTMQVWLVRLWMRIFLFHSCPPPVPSDSFSSPEGLRARGHGGQ